MAIRDFAIRQAVDKCNTNAGLRACEIKGLRQGLGSCRRSSAHLLENQKAVGTGSRCGGK